jgi:hypothetical protein
MWYHEWVQPRSMYHVECSGCIFYQWGEVQDNEGQWREKILVASGSLVWLNCCYRFAEAHPWEGKAFLGCVGMHLSFIIATVRRSRSSTRLDLLLLFREKWNGYWWMKRVAESACRCVDACDVAILPGVCYTRLRRKEKCTMRILC